MITRNEIVKLLALCAGADQRTVAPEDVALWHGIAQTERWQAAAAQRAIIEHYAHGADRHRITPAVISDRLRAIRGRAAESFEAPKIPPGLANVDYPGWVRTLLREHVDGQLTEWATTGAEPSRSLPIEPALIRNLKELTAAAPPHARAEIAAAAQKLTSRRVVLDPHRREEAIAELEAVRRAQGDTA